MLQAAKDTGMGSQFYNTQRATSKQELPLDTLSHGPAQGTRVRSCSMGQPQGQNKAKAIYLPGEHGSLP